MYLYQQKRATYIGLCLYVKFKIFLQKFVEENPSQRPSLTDIFLAQEILQPQVAGTWEHILKKLDFLG